MIPRNDQLGVCEPDRGDKVDCMQAGDDAALDDMLARYERRESLRPRSARDAFVAAVTSDAFAGSPELDTLIYELRLKMARLAASATPLHLAMIGRLEAMVRAMLPLGADDALEAFEVGGLAAAAGALEEIVAHARKGGGHGTRPV
jgi:hypothetical protein